MSLLLTSSVTAMGPKLTTSFLAVGGTPPYTYSVLPNGAGGSIDSAGLYTAPAIVNPDPKKSSDVIQVQDSLGATAILPILIAGPLGLFCEIIQRELALVDGRVYMWDQKINQPTDNGLYVAVSVESAKPFGNNTKTDGSGSGLDAVQSVNMLATLGLDIISRGPEARDRKEEIILALNSIYSQSQQELNSFYIGKISTNFLNLSPIDGAAIPYRFKISVNIQYMVTKTKAVPYFDDFAKVELTTES